MDIIYKKIYNKISYYIKQDYIFLIFKHLKIIKYFLIFIVNKG